MYDEPIEVIDRTTSEFISLIVGAQSFCVEIDKIREIRRWEPITKLPHSPAYVLGVVNLRGAVIPIVDLAVKLGFPQTSPTKRNVIIISNYGGKLVGLLVESVSEILTVKSDEINDTPSIRNNAISSLIRGVISNEGDMNRVLDIDLLLSTSKVMANDE